MWYKTRNGQLINLNLVQSISFGEDRGWAIYFTGNDCIEISKEEYKEIEQVINRYLIKRFDLKIF